MSNQHLIDMKWVGTIVWDFGENTPEKSVPLVLQLSGFGPSKFALLGWVPLALQGTATMDGMTHNVEEGSRLQVGPPFHKDTHIHVFFHSEEGEILRLLGEGRLQFNHPVSSATTLRGKVFLGGENRGRWKLRLSSPKPLL